MWSASALLGLRCPLLLLYWSLTPHAGQCVMPVCCARASTCFLNCLCSFVLVLLTCCSLLFSFCLLFVLGGGASQRQRDARLHRLTLLSSSLPLFLSSSLFFLLSFLRNGGCRVVRAQPCEHARNTTHASCFGLSTACGVCCFYHNVVFVVPTTHCSLLTITVFTLEHCALLITS